MVVIKVMVIFLILVVMVIIRLEGIIWKEVNRTTIVVPKVMVILVMILMVKVKLMVAGYGMISR